MATTLPQVAQFLEQAELQFTYVRDEAFPHIAVNFVTEWYARGDGEKILTLIINLDADGEILNIAAPGAFSVGADHVAAAAIAAGVIQWRTRFVQFEFDPEHGEIRPIIELLLADAELTERQLVRALGAALNVVEAYCDVLMHACASGEIDFDRYNTGEANDRTVEQLSAMLSEFTPEQIERAVAAIKKRK